MTNVKLAVHFPARRGFVKMTTEGNFQLFFTNYKNRKEPTIPVDSVQNALKWVSSISPTINHYSVIPA